MGTISAPADWRENSACADEPTDIFYPDGAAPDWTAPKRVCWDCPVRVTCLNDAIGRREQWGCWGGLTPRERARVVRVARRGDPDRAADLATMLADPDRTAGRLDPQTAEIAWRYESGESTYQLARRFSLARSTVQNRLAAAGVQTRPSGLQPDDEPARIGPAVFRCGHHNVNGNRYRNGYDADGAPRVMCRRCTVARRKAAS